MHRVPRPWADRFEGALINNGEGTEISAEGVGQLEVLDYSFTTVGVGEKGLIEHQELMIDAARNPLWAQLPIVKRQNIVPFEMEMVYGSPTGQLAFLEVVAQTFPNSCWTLTPTPRARSAPADSLTNAGRLPGD